MCRLRLQCIPLAEVGSSVVRLFSPAAGGVCEFRDWKVPADCRDPADWRRRRVLAHPGAPCPSHGQGSESSSLEETLNRAR